MLKNIQLFFLGLLKSSKQQLIELSWFAVSVALYIPSLFVVFYFVFVFGIDDKVISFGSYQVNLNEVHISLLIAFVMFLWIGFYKYLKTKLKKDVYTFSQVMVRFLLKTKYLVLFIATINMFMLKFSLTKINIYGGIVCACFLVSVYFENKYNKSAEVEWSDK